MAAASREATAVWTSRSSGNCAASAGARLASRSDGATYISANMREARTLLTTNSSPWPQLARAPTTLPRSADAPPWEQQRQLGSFAKRATQAKHHFATGRSAPAAAAPAAAAGELLSRRAAWRTAAGVLGFLGTTSGVSGTHKQRGGTPAAGHLLVVMILKKKKKLFGSCDYAMSAQRPQSVRAARRRSLTYLWEMVKEKKKIFLTVDL